MVTTSPILTSANVSFAPVAAKNSVLFAVLTFHTNVFEPHDMLTSIVEPEIETTRAPRRSTSPLLAMCISSIGTCAWGATTAACAEGEG